MRLIDGFVTTQLVYVVEKLGIPEQLEAGSKTAAELAAAVGANPARLHRVLRDLVVQEVFDELDDGRFALTPVGRHLQELRALTIVRAEVYYAAAGRLLDAVMGEEVPFDTAHGERFFDYLGHHPDTEATFQAAMADRSAQEAADVVAAYDFAPFERLVDVGGGRGVLLAAILDSVPSLRGVLFDREAAIPAAQDFLGRRALTDRVECIGGDFFTHLPPGVDAYVLSRILHDWDDGDAERILRSCHRAMRPDSRLLVVDAVLPERGCRESTRNSDGRAHAHPVRRARAWRARVSTTVRAIRVRVRGRRDDAVTDEPGRGPGPTHVRSCNNWSLCDQHGAEFRHASAP